MGDRGFKLEDGRFTLDIRKNFLTMRVGIQQDRFSRRTVDALSLKVFKVRLDGALNNPT